MTVDVVSRVREGLALTRVAVYLRVVAVLFLMSAFSHVASILGLVGGSWAAKPWYFRVADVTLLVADLVIPLGLWRTKLWGVVAWVAAVVFLQAVPMLLLIALAAPDPRLRATWYGMLAVHAVMLGAFLLLLPRTKRGDVR